MIIDFVECRVYEIGFYIIFGGVVINIMCVVVVWGVGVVLFGEEFGVCFFYGLVGGVVFVRYVSCRI